MECQLKAYSGNPKTKGPSEDRRLAKVILVGFEILLLLFVLSAQTRAEDTKVTQLLSLGKRYEQIA
jgi:hypothetical protein